MDSRGRVDSTVAMRDDDDDIVVRGDGGDGGDGVASSPSAARRRVLDARISSGYDATRGVM